MNTTGIHGLARTVREMAIQRFIELHRILTDAESTGWIPRIQGSVEDHNVDLSVDVTVSVIGLIDHADLEICHCPHCHGGIVVDTDEAEWMHVTEGPDGSVIDRLRLEDCPHCLQEIDQEWELIDGLWKSRPF